MATARRIRAQMALQDALAEATRQLDAFIQPVTEGVASLGLEDAPAPDIEVRDASPAEAAPDLELRDASPPVTRSTAELALRAALAEATRQIDAFVQHATEGVAEPGLEDPDVEVRDASPAKPTSVLMCAMLLLLRLFPQAR